MAKPIIAVDIDDVLAQGTESLRIQVNKVAGVNLLPEHYQVPGEYWGYYERVWQSNGIADKVDFAELNKEMIVDQSHVQVTPKVLDSLRELSSQYDFIVVTARDPEWELATSRWIEKNFGNIFQGIYFAGRHDSEETKGSLCKKLGAQWLIDDNIIHAHTALEHGLKVILFGEYGWHKEQVVDPRVIKCSTWSDVKDYFDEHAGK